MATGLEKVSFIPIPKKGNAKKCSNYRTIALISHSGKVMLKIFQARLQQYMNWELPDVQAEFLKRQRNQRSTCHHPLDHRKCKRIPEENISFIDYAKAFGCVGHMKLWKILQEPETPDDITSLLRNLYTDQEAIVRTGHGTIYWFQTGKGIYQDCMLSSCLFNLYAVYNMWNAGLDEAQGGIKMARRNMSNLRYANDTTLTAESKEELKSSWWKWRRRVKKLV